MRYSPRGAVTECLDGADADNVSGHQQGLSDIEKKKKLTKSPLKLRQPRRIRRDLSGWAQQLPVFLPRLLSQSGRFLILCEVHRLRHLLGRVSRRNEYFEEEQSKKAAKKKRKKDKKKEKSLLHEPMAKREGIADFDKSLTT